jgi:squalene synthase HpnC
MPLVGREGRDVVPSGGTAVPASLEGREQGENFPVALRLLPRALRGHLHALYAYARTVDELGDSAPGDRTALLEAFREDVRELWRGGRPQHPVLQQLAPTVRECALDEEPFQCLVEANLVDQRVSRYATFDDLRGYCRLSADPVGRMVLGVFGVDDPVTVELSDRVCTALQLLEHWQDVGEDRAAGRVYLPQVDLAAHGVSETELDAPVASPPLRTLMRFEIERAAALLQSGAPVVGRLHGWARVAVGGYVAGGQATVRALRRSGGEVLGQQVRPRAFDVVTALCGRLIRPGEVAP